MKPKCFLCGEKPARIIRATTVPDRMGKIKIYTNAYKEAAFCSKRCAMNYGLVSIRDVIEGSDTNEGEGWSWNEEKNAWEPNG